MSVLVASAAGLIRDGEPFALAGSDVTALARWDDGWVAVVDRSRVVAVGADGTEKPLATVAGIDAITVANGVPFVGLEAAQLLAITPGGASPVAGFEEAPDRVDWYTPWGGPPTVRSLDQGPDGMVWVNVHVGGVLVGNGGRWEQTMDIDNDVHQVIAHPTRPDTALVAAAVGLGWTVDGGDSWSWTDDGLAARYSRAVAVDGDTVFLSASRGPGGQGATLYRGQIGQPLEACEGIGRHRTNIDTGWIAAADGLATVAVPDGTVLVSNDGGDSWEAAFTVDSPRAVAISRA